MVNLSYSEFRKTANPAYSESRLGANPAYSESCLHACAFAWGVTLRFLRYNSRALVHDKVGRHSEAIADFDEAAPPPSRAVGSPDVARCIRACCVVCEL